MKKAITSLLLVLIGYAASAQWQTIFKDSAHYWCTSVWFINNDTGFVGAANPLNPSFSGSVLRTFNGGQTWDTTQFPFAVYAVQFVDDSTGFAGGQDGRIYRTDNRGDTWSWDASGFCCYDLFSFHFFNRDTGLYAVASSDIMRTTNSGLAWQSAFSNIGSTSYPGRSRFTFPDPLTGYQTQFSFTRTADGGITWTNMATPAVFQATSAWFFNALEGVVVGYNGMVILTDDGGNSWKNFQILDTSPFSDVAFVNDSTGYIVGGFDHFNYSNTNGIIYVTHDRGITWQVMDDGYFDGLLKLHFPSDSVGYAVGMNGIILKIINAHVVATGLQDETQPGLQVIILFDPTTLNLTIEHEIKHSGTAALFDTSGRLVSTKALTPMLTIMDLSGLAGGVYVARVLSGTSFYAGKVLVPK